VQLTPFTNCAVNIVDTIDTDDTVDTVDTDDTVRNVDTMCS